MSTRKKRTESSGNIKRISKNPLAVALGAVFKRKRNELGRSSEEIAEAFGIRSSFYRLVESGTNHVHISKVLNIVDAFDGELSFDGLVKVISCISIMEVHRDKKSEDIGGYTYAIAEAIEKFSAYDEKKLKLLFLDWDNNFFSDFRKSEAAFEIDEWLEKTRFVNKLEKFIADYDNFGQEGKQHTQEYIQNYFKRLPSIYLETLNDLRDSLLRLPVRVGFGTLSDWEGGNRHRFVRHRILVEDISLLLAEDNLKQYTYLHLWEKKLERIDIIYCGNKNIDEVQEKFTINLKSGLKAENQAAKVTSLNNKINRISFHQFKDKNIYYKLRNILSIQNTEINEEMNGIWSFVFDNNLTTGFIANISNKGRSVSLEKGICLSYPETARFNREFDKLIEKPQD